MLRLGRSLSWRTLSSCTVDVTLLLLVVLWLQLWFVPSIMAAVGLGSPAAGDVPSNPIIKTYTANTQVNAAAISPTKHHVSEHWGRGGRERGMEFRVQVSARPLVRRVCPSARLVADTFLLFPV